MYAVLVLVLALELLSSAAAIWLGGQERCMARRRTNFCWILAHSESLDPRRRFSATYEGKKSIFGLDFFFPFFFKKREKE
jgi:hypothetical protein